MLLCSLSYSLTVAARNDVTGILGNIGFTKEKTQTGITHRLHRTKQGGQQNTGNAHILKDSGVFRYTASDTDAHIHSAQTDFPVNVKKAF